MKSYKITVWVDTEQDKDYVATQLEQMELYSVQYSIEEVTSA